MRTLFIASFTAMLAGCPSPAAETPDAPGADAQAPGADATSIVDVGSSTEDATLDAHVVIENDAAATGDAWMSSAGRACLFHTQCDEGQRCESGGVGSPRRCAVSALPRGTGAFESTCTNNDDCASGVCWSSGFPEVGMRCSQACVTNAECGTVLNACRDYARTDFRFCDHSS